MVVNFYLMKKYSNSINDPERFRRLVGKQNYLTVTCLDISFIVSTTSLFLSVLIVKHWLASEYILWYLKGAQGLGIIYSDHKCFARKR